MVSISVSLDKGEALEQIGIPRVAKELGLTPPTVRAWIRAGRIQAECVEGRLYVRRFELDRLLAVRGLIVSKDATS